jgi:hypothetical protein
MIYDECGFKDLVTGFFKELYSTVGANSADHVA